MLTEQQIEDYKNCSRKDCNTCSMGDKASDCGARFYKNEVGLLKDRINKINDISVDLQETQYSQQEVFDKATEIYNLSREVEE